MFLIALLEEWEAVTSTTASHRVSAKGKRKKRPQISCLMLSLKLCDCRSDVLCLFKMQIKLQKALSLHEGGLTPLKWYSWPLWAQLMLPSWCHAYRYHWSLRLTEEQMHLVRFAHRVQGPLQSSEPLPYISVILKRPKAPSLCKASCRVVAMSYNFSIKSIAIIAHIKWNCNVS